MLLTAATELAYHTVNCSALNAEELNRENGFVVSEFSCEKFVLRFLSIFQLPVTYFMNFRLYGRRTLDACLC